jgi:CRISPR system Cascade subunit CasC
MKLIELHILQSFPVSCLNRDDVGAPKTATFGGVTRARISSQCLKRAIREFAKSEYPRGRFTGIRTKLIATEIQKALTDLHQVPEHRALEMACAVAGLLNKKEGKPLPTDDPELETLFFASPSQLTAMADLAFKEFGANGEIKADKKKFVKACRDVGVHDAADIALFGRMVAADASLTLEGAAMFSHALSTHRADNDIDFFSAIDEKKDKAEDAGAGMIGTLEFTSACYYRYAGLNLTLLENETHLGKLSTQDRKDVVDAFLRASILAVPGARRNSMNSNTGPAFVLGLFKDKGQPLQLINAFEKPIRACGNNGLIQPSVRAGLLQLRKLEDFIGETAAVKVATGTYCPEPDTDDRPQLTKESIPEFVSLAALCTRLTDHVA